MYLDFFGREDGWIVYREVHLAAHRQARRDYETGKWKRFARILAHFCAFEAMLFWLLHYLPNGDLKCMMLLAMPCVLVIMFLLLVPPGVGKERAIEYELRRATRGDCCLQR